MAKVLVVGKCACGQGACNGELRFIKSFDGNKLVLRPCSEDGISADIVFDANLLVDLISAAKQVLHSLVGNAG